MPRVHVFPSIADAEPTWRQIETDGMALPYQCFDWIDVWFETIGRTTGQEPCPVAVFDDDDSPMALFPLGVARGRHLRALTWLGAELGNQLAPMLSGRGLNLGADEFASIWEQVLRSAPACDLVSLRRQPATIYGYPNPMVRPTMQLDGHSRLADLSSSDWETFHRSRMGAKERRNERRNLRRLADHGPVDFEIVSGAQALTEAVETMVDQKRRRFRETDRNDMFEDEGFAHFYGEMTKRSEETTGAVQLTVMRVGGEIAATDWSVISHRTMHGLVTTFSDRFAKWSPGTLLRAHLLEWCFDNDIDTVDFSSGDESYKQKWCDVTIPLHRDLAPRSLRGHASLAVTRVKEIRANRGGAAGAPG